MKPSEVSKLLGITSNRIKYLKREGVFTPQRQTIEGRSTDYTTHDIAELKKLVVLSKLGLTCSDIKKLQNGSWTLEEALIERRKAIESKIRRLTRSAELAEAIMNDNAKFDTFNVDYYWKTIIQKEAAESAHR